MVIKETVAYFLLKFKAGFLEARKNQKEQELDRWLIGRGQWGRLSSGERGWE